MTITLDDLAAALEKYAAAAAGHRETALWASIDRARCHARGVRPWTPDWPQRRCEECGHYLGDATGDEIATVAHGLPLAPAAAPECGCQTSLVCAHCLAPAHTPSCCAAADGIHLEITERALTVFRHQEASPA